MIRQLFASQLRRNMLSGLITAFVNLAVLGFAYPIYLTFFGYELYGVWLVLATVLGAAQLGDLGVTQAVTKLVAEEHGKHNLRGVEGYVCTALGTLLASGVLILSIILYFGRPIVGAFKLSGPNEVVASQLLPYIAVLSCYTLIVQAMCATLAGLGRIDLANYCRTAGKILAVCVALAFLLAGYGMESLLIGAVLSQVAVHVASVTLIRRTAPVRLLRFRQVSVDRLKRLLGFGGAVFGSSVISMLFGPFNKLMLSRYAGVAVLPVYEIGFNCAVGIRSLLETPIRPLMVEISRLSAEATTAGVQRIRAVSSRSLRLVSACGLPLYAVLFFASEMILLFWLRDKYDAAVPFAFRLALVCTLLSLLAAPAYYTLLGLGKANCALVATSITCVGNFILVSGTALLANHVSVGSIFMGLIFLNVIAAAYLIGTAARVLKHLSTGLRVGDNANLL
ncbi:MAG: oligosaccharide flippase family protein [Phycisphaerales bacterium]|nr:MAG: oligosaccharide flippase family protein [Phycisphaerales bacterium]